MSLRLSTDEEARAVPSAFYLAPHVMRTLCQVRPWGHVLELAEGEKALSEVVEQDERPRRPASMVRLP